VAARARPGTRSLIAPALAAVIVAMLATAPRALAHAQLLGTSPAPGSSVPVVPKEVTFEFNQNVGGTLGAVRVYDAQGNEVDDLDVSHPGGNEHWMGVGLKQNLPDGTYTATYRVISADTHIVYGGLVFSIGHPGAAPRFTVAGLIGRNESGEATKLAFGVVRALDYLTIAIFVGGVAFMLGAWLPALGASAGTEPRWAAASRAYAGRQERLLAFAVVLGAIVSVLGVLLQGASAAGVSLWSSLKGAVLENTLESRFGNVWGARAIVWLLLGALLIAAKAMRRDIVPTIDDRESPQSLGTGERPRLARPPTLLLAVLVLGCAYLVITPALAGHASIQSPTAVFFPSDVLHVLGASVWVGGIACLLMAVPKATRQLEPPERTPLLLGALARFSPMALAGVIAISATGVIQAYIDVRNVEGLLHSTYGALIIAKVALLVALIGLGWINRERVIPMLRRLAGAGSTPGAAGGLARRTMRGELALMLCVFGVTSALITYAPPIDAATGPFSTSTTLGAAELEMTVEPAKVGLNTVHLYLIDAKTGAQFTATKELTASARLPSKGIGPLPLKTTLAGPGHYILSNAVLSPGGTWSVEIVDRVSEFEEFTRVVKVPIR
jgi:copper transport protein